MVVTANKLENERLDKLRNLSNDELTDYVENLILESFKGIKGDGFVENPDMDDAIDKLNEITDITLKRNPNCNIKDVIMDRKLSYFRLAYLSAIFYMENLKDSLNNLIELLRDTIRLKIAYYSLLDKLNIYYDVYSNYGFMENLLFDLDDDGLAVDSDIYEKYVYGKEYRFNQKIMRYLDMEIDIDVEIILDEIAKLDEKYLVDNAAEIDETIDVIHEGIRNFYKNNTDFEISAYKQSGLLDVELNSIKNLKKDFNSEYYLKLKDKILSLIDGENGFADLSANDFERYKKRNPDADFDEWIKTKPKYDVRNAKFIYPEKY